MKFTYEKDLCQKTFSLKNYVEQTLKGRITGMMNRKSHWEEVYSTKATNAVSWYQEHSELSLKLIHQTELPKTVSIIDVGGGASSLVDDLVKLGYSDISVLDISKAALDVAKSRVQSEDIDWIEGDITQIDLPENRYDIWHDRAVFHFLTTSEDRQKYAALLKKTLRTNGHVIMATFSETGPERCSGLEVRRYSAEKLQEELGKDFKLINYQVETQKTPFNTEQNFIYCHFQKQ